MLLILVPGCVTTEQVGSNSSFYVDKDSISNNIAQTALVELVNETKYPGISPKITRQLYKELQKQQLFSITVIDKENPEWRRLQLEDKPSYTIRELSRIYKSLNYDALIFGKITEYKPYPHLMLGIKLKMVDLKNAKLLWGFEQIWDSEDKSTEYRIREYLKDRIAGQSRGLQDELVTVSSQKFLKFTAYETANTFK
jgi:hypothetical protein